MFNSVNDRDHESLPVADRTSESGAGPDARLHLLDSLTTDLPAWLAARGEGKFRVGQIYHWLFTRRAWNFDVMTNLPSVLRQALHESFRIARGTQVKHHEAADGTEKLLLQWSDGRQVECVLLRDGARRTICISTQVGCAMGCVFCASGIGGVERNLTTGEILEQALLLQQRLPLDERLTHIVVMGMGEPLANIDRLLPALEWASRPDGLGISPRRITISTVGLPAAMDKLTARATKFHLAVSLHAPDDALRTQLVPVNATIGLNAILAAADRYFEASGRRLTYEYVLLAGINDRQEDAKRLARLLKGRPALLNVIPYNPVAGLPYATPSSRALREFLEILAQEGLTVKVRHRKGDKINAACGQLRRQALTRDEVSDHVSPA